MQLAPAEFLIEMKNNEISGLHCLEYTNPEFRDRVKQGFNIVVAGKGFGHGSSREQAVMALLGKPVADKVHICFQVLTSPGIGCGVQCVIARSFSFIFQRNMPNLGLLGITMQNDTFFKAAQDGKEVSINFNNRTIHIAEKSFQFQLSQMEKELFDYGGITSAFRHFGNKLFEAMTAPTRLKGPAHHEGSTRPHAVLQW